MLITRRTVVSSALAGLTGMTPSVSVAGESALAAGFHMPDEAAPHERTFMQWPVNPTVHEDPIFLAMLQKTIASIANAISEFEPVVMLMAVEHAERARPLLGKAVDIWDIPTDDLWARDSGPAFVVDGKGGLALTQFNFNGWGGKQVHGNDGQIAARIGKRLGFRFQQWPRRRGRRR